MLPLSEFDRRTTTVAHVLDLAAASKIADGQDKEDALPPGCP